MKKIYIIFAALAVTFSAKAQLGFLAGCDKGFGCNYRSSENCVGESGSFRFCDGEWCSVKPAVNQRFTYAIKVTDPDILIWLAGEEGRTLALADFRTNAGGPESVNKVPAIRLVNIGQNIYAIDMVISQMMPAHDFAQMITEGNNRNNIMHFTLTGADTVGQSTWNYSQFGYGNFNVALATSIDAAEIEWDENVDPKENASPSGGRAVGLAEPSCNNCIIDAIGDVTTDGKIIVGYYNILGVKLNNEPKSGVFIETYSDGTFAKIVK